ncbi:hypothetical protein CL629_01885 [bacterium]|nr:hypothetical protein [bacterium]|tara:strand:- start:1771 stop:2199 length:429 start_codon:yes stop_codon:yes gene_type:complete
MGERKQFVESEILIGVIFFSGLDGIAALIDVTGVGMAIAPILQSFGTGVITVWLWSKGNKAAVKPGRQIALHLANIIPFVPTVAFVFFVTAYIHNHPGKIGSLLAIGKGKMPNPEAKIAGGRRAKAKAAPRQSAEEELELAA